jgi:TPR repeat protein
MRHLVLLIYFAVSACSIEPTQQELWAEGCEAGRSGDCSSLGLWHAQYDISWMQTAPGGFVLTAEGIKTGSVAAVSSTADIPKGLVLLDKACADFDPYACTAADHIRLQQGLEAERAVASLMSICNEKLHIPSSCVLLGDHHLALGQSEMAMAAYRSGCAWLEQNSHYKGCDDGHRFHELAARNCNKAAELIGSKMSTNADYEAAVPFVRASCKAEDALGCENLRFFTAIGVAEGDRDVAITALKTACERGVEISCRQLKVALGSDPAN